ILAMDMTDPFRTGPGDRRRVYPSVNGMAAVEDQADMVPGDLEEAIQFRLGLDRGAKVVVVGESQALIVDIAGHLVEPFAKALPFIPGKDGVGIQATARPVAVGRVGGL